MKEQYISLETAKLAKELGFNIHCDNRYTPEGLIISWITHNIEIFFEDIDNNQGYCDHYSKYLRERYKDEFNNDDDEYIAAPTQSLLQKWLREVHGLHVQPQKTFFNTTYLLGKILIETRLEGEEFKSVYGSPRSYNNSTSKKFVTYEEALEVGLVQALNLIK